MISDRNGIAVTSLCQKSNLSHGRLQNFLTKLGLVLVLISNQIEFDGIEILLLLQKKENSS